MPVIATGIGSGLDIENLVTQLIEAERQPTETRLLQNEAQITSSLSAFGQFGSALVTLESSMNTLSSASIFDQRVASSSNNSAVVASANEDSAEGSYQVSVEQLARSHSLASSAFSSLEDEVGTGSLTIRFGTTDYTGPDPGPEAYNSFSVNSEENSLTLEIDSSNNSLQGLRDAINDASAGVSASIVNDGSGYRLLLTSSSSGENHSLEISVDDDDSDDSDTSGLSQLAFNASATNMEQTVEAQDALININGIAVSSESNEVTSAIDGVTLFVNEVTESSVDIEISVNTSASISAIQQLASAYNSFVDTTNAVASYNAESQTGGPLQGDFTVRSLANQLRQALSGSATNALGGVQYLSEVGLQLQVDGKLNFDTSKYLEVYEENPAAVTGLFANIGVSDSNNIEYLSASESTQTGDYNVLITQAATRATLTGNALGLPITIDSNNKNFTLDFDGISAAIELSEGTYSTSADLLNELSSKINTHEELVNAGIEVEVSEHSTTGFLQIQAKEYGSEISMEMIYADANFTSEFGFTLNDVQTGLDVEGSIDGITASGSGQILTASEGSDADGLKILITGEDTGSIGQIAYSSGLFGQLSDLLALYTGDDGTINSRITSYESQISDIDDQREFLEERLISLEERYRAQFNALDGLLAQLQTTSDFLTQQLDSLPGAKPIE